MCYRSKYISLNVIPSEWYDAKCDTVLSICGVKCMGEWVKFFEKLAGIFGGRNEKVIFVKKG